MIAHINNKYIDGIDIRGATGLQSNHSNIHNVILWSKTIYCLTGATHGFS